MKPIKNIAFVVNAQKPNAEDVANVLIKETELLDVGIKYSNTRELPKGFLEGQDACSVIGGDGTLLSVVGQSIQYQVPVFGINHGKLGFLATLSPKEALNSFRSILSGNYKIQARTTLSCSMNGSNETLALNDVVIKNTKPYRLIELEVFCNDEFITSYYSDGLLFSTPTGSTAYNLSAGGPIILPDNRVFAMTPISPHTLSNRSVIFDSSNIIKIALKQKESQTYVTIDGNTEFSETSTFPLSVGISDQTFPLLQTLEYSYFHILRSKLRWGN